MYIYIYVYICIYVYIHVLYLKNKYIGVQVGEETVMSYPLKTKLSHGSIQIKMGLSSDPLCDSAYLYISQADNLDKMHPLSLSDPFGMAIYIYIYIYIYICIYI
jgi:hypothetical protein